MASLSLQLHTFIAFGASEEDLQKMVTSMEQVGWKAGQLYTYQTQHLKVYARPLISAVGVPAVEDSPRLLLV